MDDFGLLVDLIREFGLWLVFAYLYTSEKKAHNETRSAYFEDLRDIAGVRPQLRPKDVNLQDLDE